MRLRGRFEQPKSISLNACTIFLFSGVKQTPDLPAGYRQRSGFV
jgi:hypothetical protein